MYTRRKKEKKGGKTSSKGDKKIRKNCSYALDKIIQENMVRLCALKLRKSFSNIY